MGSEQTLTIKGLIGYPIATEVRIEGGTWLMPAENGYLRGEWQDTVGDNWVYQTEHEVGKDQKKLAEKFDKVIRRAEPYPMDISEIFNWAGEDIGKYAQGIVIPIFAGDSTQRRPAIAAPMMVYSFEGLVKRPNVRQLKGKGTDTGAIDAAKNDPFIFDVNVVGMGTAGANRSYQEDNPDAPYHFRNLFQTPHHWLKPGNFWHWYEYIFSGADIHKVDPAEDPREIDGTSTFLSPSNLKITLESLLRNPKQDIFHHYMVPNEHIICRINWEQLFDVMNQTWVCDMGPDNPPNKYLLGPFTDTDIKALVIAGFGLGNAYDLVREEAAEAAKEGKLVVATSTCLRPAISKRYLNVSLLSINDTLLANEKAKILDGRRLNKISLSSLLYRALLEDLDQGRTQELIDRYAIARDLY